MARMTMLEMVRDIYLDVSGGEYIYTINQNTVTTQITEILERTYYSIIDGKDWPNLYKPFQLIETSSVTPTHMEIPTLVYWMDYVKYNTRNSIDTRDKYTLIHFLEPKEFMNFLDSRNSSDSNINVITDASGIKLNIYNDRAPKMYSSFDEKTVVFDAYDIAVETFLKTNKTQCYGKVYPTVVPDDNFVFDLPTDAFSYLLNEAKAIAFTRIVKQTDPHAEKDAVSQRRRMSQESWKIRNGITYSDYGRRSRK